ncbi:PadR family transcriptional regulator [Qipengyuania sp.]|uniref:PadR family transcriptional regulator n=1 Tax=Qipengyuania sp. TaxID=2004515 RepID=UPI0035C8272F
MYGSRNFRKWGRDWPVTITMGAKGRDGDFGDMGGFFGPDGFFGPRGPFGPDGPFGPKGPFGPGGDQRGRDRGYRGRRRQRMFAQGELRLLLLRLIADEPRHGYELIKAIEDMTGGSYAPSPGTIYPTLSLLEDEGAIREVEGDEPRRAYQVTEKGRDELKERAEDAAALMERLTGQAEDRAQRHRAFATPEMFRALGNLAQVVKNKARHGRLDEDTMAEIVDLIDEMARKIERL